MLPIRRHEYRGGRYQTGNIFGGFFYAFLQEIPVLGQIFQFLKKVSFADLTYIRPITTKFRGGNDFNETNREM